MLLSRSSLCLYRPQHTTALFFSGRHLLRRPFSSNINLLCVWSYTSSHPSRAPTPPASLEKMEEQTTIGVDKVEVLKQKMELLGIVCDASCVPGRYTNLMCPKCNGGPSLERSLSVHIVEKGDLVLWRCFRTECSWADQVLVDGRAAHSEVKKKVQSSRQMTAESLGLEPLGEKVEGEVDKLSVEEAGFSNCVSVPDGAPGNNSAKLPPVEKDTAYQYLWNCKEHLDKVSRIILATDNDKPGKTLASGIAHRLGAHRCWQVSWPKKDEISYYKDANEVLMCMGPDALRNLIKNAEPYQLSIPDEVVQSSD